MHRSLHLLATLKNSNSVAARDAMSEDQRKGLDAARRRVKSYFFRALSLNECGYIDDALLKSIIWVAGLNLLQDVVEPLEDNSEETPKYQRLREFGRYPITARPVETPPNTRREGTTDG